jgi:hypothetical protein
MGAIYHMAVLAIVSLGDDPESGLPGVSRRERQKSPQDQLFPIQCPDCSCCHPRAFSLRSASMTTQSRWNTRGWTYQEKVLSRRHLFVGEKLCFFNCGFDDQCGELLRSDWLESFGGYGREIYGIPKYVPKHQDKVDHENYAEVVQDYTGRTLTHSKDILDTFAGVGTILTTRMHTTFLFGLPEKYLLRALLWHHRGPSDKRYAVEGVPSWSWAAWEGNATYGYEVNSPCTVNPLESREDCTIGSLVRFHYSDPKRGFRSIEDGRQWFTKFGEYSTKVGGEGDEGHMKLWSNMPRWIDWEDETIWQVIEFGLKYFENGEEVTEDSKCRGKENPGSLVFNNHVHSLVLNQFRKEKVQTG